MKSRPGRPGLVLTVAANLLDVLLKALTFRMRGCMRLWLSACRDGSDRLRGGQRTRRDFQKVHQEIG